MCSYAFPRKSVGLNWITMPTIQRNEMLNERNESKSNNQSCIEWNEITRYNCIGKKKNKTFSGKSVTTIQRFGGYKMIFRFELWCNAYDELEHGACVSFLLDFNFFFFLFRESSILVGSLLLLFVYRNANFKISILGTKMQKIWETQTPNGVRRMEIGSVATNAYES